MLTTIICRLCQGIGTCSCVGWYTSMGQKIITQASKQTPRHGLCLSVRFPSFPQIDVFFMKSLSGNIQKEYAIPSHPMQSAANYLTLPYIIHPFISKPRFVDHSWNRL